MKTILIIILISLLYFVIFVSIITFLAKKLKNDHIRKFRTLWIIFFLINSIISLYFYFT